MRRMMVVLMVGALLSLGLVPATFAASSVTQDVDPATYSCTQPTFEDFEDIPAGPTIDGQTYNGMQFTGAGLDVRTYDGQIPMQGAQALLPFYDGQARITFVYGAASSVSFLAAVYPEYEIEPYLYLSFRAYDAGGVLLESAHIEGWATDINSSTGHSDTHMVGFTFTRSQADIAYFEMEGEMHSYVVDAICTDAPNTPPTPATATFHQPLAPSTSAGIVRNKAKAGRTIPVKVEIALDGVEQDATNVAAPPDDRRERGGVQHERRGCG